MHQSTSRTTRRLVVMRHAKAEPGGQSDHERALAERGHGDAADAGRWLAAQGFVARPRPRLDAARTQETWDAVAAGAGWDVEPDFDDGLYAAGPDTALDLMRETPARRARSS